jgi:hypothetical protein
MYFHIIEEESCKTYHITASELFDIHDIHPSTFLHSNAMHGLYLWCIRPYHISSRLGCIILCCAAMDKCSAILWKGTTWGSIKFLNIGIGAVRPMLVGCLAEKPNCLQSVGRQWKKMSGETMQSVSLAWFFGIYAGKLGCLLFYETAFSCTFWTSSMLCTSFICIPLYLSVYHSPSRYHPLLQWLLLSTLGSEIKFSWV